MLSDESVPQADSVLAALTKHLEAKLSFSEKQAIFIAIHHKNKIRSRRSKFYKALKSVSSNKYCI